MRAFISMLFLITSIVLLQSCISHTRPILYEPQENNDLQVSNFYHKGQPLGYIETEDYSLTFLLNSVKISKSRFFSIWIDIKNNSEQKILIIPQESFQLVIVPPASTENEKIILSPELPSSVLSLIKKDKDSALFLTALSGILQAASYESRYAADAKIDATTSEMGLISENYEFYGGSIDEGSLKKHTLFESDNVSGFVYFKYTSALSKRYLSKEVKYYLQINIPGLERLIQFIPVDGE